MNNLIIMPRMLNWRTKYRYAVYERNIVEREGRIYSRAFIVVKNEYGVIVRFTRLHEFVTNYDGRVFRPITTNVVNKMRYVCMMLNYILLDHYEIYRIDHVFGITRESLECFFMDYALSEKKTGGYRGEESIEKCVSTVSAFFRKMISKYGGYMELREEDLYKEKEVYTHKGKIEKHMVPSFEIYGIPTVKRIFRDIPTQVFQLLLNLAIRYTPDIALAIALQAFAGLRPGEVCNVRQENSPAGRGIAFTYIDGKPIKVEIDLTREIAMRSDGVVCGRIKKERKQCVYTPFIEAFCTVYRKHLLYLEAHSFETEYCPLFINSKGLAMTYENYADRFHKLVYEHLRPMLIDHPDPECRIYGQMLYENNLGPHSLRHWFSVQLALRGEDVAQLQFWRGDKDPQSAFLYLQNKGDLMRELSKSNEMLAAILMAEAKRYE